MEKQSKIFWVILGLLLVILSFEIIFLIIIPYIFTAIVLGYLIGMIIHIIISQINYQNSKQFNNLTENILKSWKNDNKKLNFLISEQKNMIINLKKQSKFKIGGKNGRTKRSVN